MRESMADDPVQPILWEPHLLALDRRVTSVLSAVADCIKAHSIHDVIYTNDLPWIFHKTWNYLQLNVKSIRLMIAALEFNCVSITLMRFWNWFFFEIFYENKNNLRDACTNGIFIYFQSFKPFSLSNGCYFGEFIFLHYLFIYHFFRSSRVHFCSFTLNRNVRALLTQTERVKNKRICRKKANRTCEREQQQQH